MGFCERLSGLSVSTSRNFSDSPTPFWGARGHRPTPHSLLGRAPGALVRRHRPYSPLPFFLDRDHCRHCFLTGTSTKVFNQQLPQHAFQVVTGNTFHDFFAQMGMSLPCHPSRCLRLLRFDRLCGFSCQSSQYPRLAVDRKSSGSQSSESVLI